MPDDSLLDTSPVTLVGMNGIGVRGWCGVRIAEQIRRSVPSSKSPGNVSRRWAFSAENPKPGAWLVCELVPDDTSTAAIVSRLTSPGIARPLR